MSAAFLAAGIVITPTSVLGAGNTLWACGYNGFGQLGDGTTTRRATPVLSRVDGIDTEIVQVACGYDHVLALGRDGSVWAWGSNWDGQLGDATRLKRSVPQRVPNLPPMSQIAAGYGFSLALEPSGSVWSWGSNWHGQLGDSSLMYRAIPAVVAGLSQVSQIAAGKEHSLAADLDGTVSAWGANASGQVGDGTLVDRYSPVVVLSLGGVRRLAAGGDHSLALASNGNAYVWGSNWAGQLGSGSFADCLTPLLLPDSHFDRIDAGANHTLAIQGGAGFSWGRNDSGQLGLGDREDRSSPCRVDGLSDVVSVALGGDFSLGVSSSGRVWSWGDGSDGQLADGTFGSDRLLPENLISIHDAIAVAAGNEFFVVLSKPRQISGSYSDATWLGEAYPQLILQLRASGTSQVVQSLAVSPDASGSWFCSVASSIPSGSYDLYASARHWLRKRIGTVMLTMGGVSGIEVALVNGDIDGDNAITAYDYELLSDAFDSVIDDANWNADADLDGDGAVTVFDYNIVSQNFDQVGDD